MLRILDYLAAPFGSLEHNLMFYGVEGKDYQYDDQDNPVLTELGHREVGDAQSAWYSLTSAQPTWYSPADPRAPEMYQGYEKLLAPMGVENASIGTFSSTFASKGTILLEGIGGAAQDIIAGRRNLSEWEQLVKDWQSNGGNQIKSELAASYAQLTSG
jgi:putative aldouronate transport system substrate-binding protein